MDQIIQSVWAGVYVAKLAELKALDNKLLNKTMQHHRAMESANLQVLILKEIASEHLAQQPYQPPEGAIELATRLRERILNACSQWTELTQDDTDDVLRLLDMVIGTPDGGSP